MNSMTDEVLRYVDRMLMEDNMDDDDEANRLILESSDLQATERSFYELLGQEYPPPQPDKAVITRGKIVNPHPDDEFDTWTYADGGCCEKLASDITGLRNASNEARQKQRNKEKEKKKKKTEVDIRSLLISCAQSIASCDHLGTNELLRQIRPHSNQFGEVDQRVAHYFVRGLEARLDGTGGTIYQAFAYERMSASDYLAAYCTSFVSSSFRRVSVFTSNKLIAVKSMKSERVHVINFGILHGFQWPSFIRRLSEREGGPPKLRITGIDFPGGDSTDRIESTGARLARYAEKFGVQFEYNSIVKSWESIRVEDLKIEKGEYVAVNCLYRCENLESDEMLVTERPRSKFLDLVRKVNPDVFVNAVVNGGYGVPYFVTRFREAFFSFSTLFDMIGTIIPSGRPERMLLEGILGNEAMNAIACEGWERVVRPETTIQWRQRHLRAGLKQVPLGRNLMNSIVNKVRSCYHKEFVVFEDNKWLMMSWKGKTICGLSCWET